MAVETQHSAVATEWVTGDDLRAMGDIGPCELVAGRIIAMVPPGAEHGRIENLIGWHLLNFANTHQSGWVLSGEAGLYTRRNPDSVRGMDVAFISRERLPSGPGEGYLEVAPELVVEIVSPSDRWQAIEDKISEYFAVGVALVWVVHPRQRAVYVYRSQQERLRLDSTGTLEGEGVLAGLRLPVAALF